MRAFLPALLGSLLVFSSAGLADTSAPCADGDRAPYEWEMTPDDLEALESLQSEQMATMGPVFGQMAEQMLQGTFAALARPETTEQLAAFSKRYYDALIEQGFEPDQALRIVVGFGIPTLQ
jgi:hypothetical protein